MQVRNLRKQVIARVRLYHVFASGYNKKLVKTSFYCQTSKWVLVFILAKRIRSAPAKYSPAVRACAQQANTWLVLTKCTLSEVLSIKHILHLPTIVGGYQVP
jgi:hypothetical protein